jgi:hypothetical protein
MKTLRFFEIKSVLLSLISGMGLLLTLSSCTERTKASGKETVKESNYYVAAYVWPSCHDDRLKGHELLWPEGTGEWEVIKKGNPRFEGHYQPKQPLWGYELDNDPKVLKKWIDAAIDHGVNVFIYDWYWYDEGPFLESALNDGFLKAENNEKMHFYIMWANHDVKKNYWNYHKYGDDTSILWDAAVDWNSFKIIVERIIRQYFHKPNYFRIHDCPVFAIFSLDKLKQSFNNSDEETRKALDYFRDEVKKAGFPDLHLQLILGGGYYLTEESGKNMSESLDKMGFNSVTFYNMGGRTEDYVAYGTNSLKIREQWDKAMTIPLFPCVSVGWDDTPRFPAYGMKDVVHYNNTPESFAALLSKAKKYADSHPEQPKLITINAWNEWVEGSYLLPDMKNGFGYLEAVKDVFINRKYDEY